MREPAFIVKIAADSISALRRPDVFRVLDSCSDAERAPTAEYIQSHRPDLAQEVTECLLDKDDTVNLRATHTWKLKPGWRQHSYCISCGTDDCSPKQYEQCPNTDAS